MKVKRNNLNKIIDDYLKENKSKHILNEQPSGTNTMVNFRYGDTGGDCSFNITSLLTKAGMDQDPAEKINKALGFICTRFLGMNEWYCELINIGLKVPSKLIEDKKSTKSGNPLQSWASDLNTDDFINTIYKDVKTAPLNKKEEKLFSGRDSVLKRLKGYHDQHLSTNTKREDPRNFSQFLHAVVDDRNIFNNTGGGGMKKSKKLINGLDRGDTDTYESLMGDFIEILTKSDAAKAAFRRMDVDSKKISNFHTELGGLLK
jgi:hypothetical protein